MRFASGLPPLLLTVGAAEVDMEQARLAARRKRAARKEANGAADATGSGAATPQPGSAPATPGPATPKLTKKEQQRQNKPVQTEEALRRQSNITANLQLGGFSSKYKWMTAASGGGAGGDPAMSMSPGTGLREKLAAGVLGKRKDKEKLPKAEPVLTDRFKTVGRLQEKPGIELRDIVGVMELEGGKEAKVLVRGYARLQRNEQPPR